MATKFVECPLQAISVAADDLDTDGITSEQATRKFFGNDGQLGGTRSKDAMNLRRVFDAESFEYAANNRFHALGRIAGIVKFELRIGGRLFHATTMRAMGSLSQEEFSGSLAYAYAWDDGRPPFVVWRRVAEGRLELCIIAES